MRPKKICWTVFPIALFAVLALISSVAMAQYQTVILAHPIYVRSLTGHVQDTNKNAVHDARVELFDPESGKLLASTTTDINGNFHFEGFVKTAYKLKVSMRSFDPLEATLRIRKNAPKSAVLTLVVAT